MKSMEFSPSVLTIYFYYASTNVQFNPKLLEGYSKDLLADPIQILFEREKERKGVFLPPEKCGKPQSGYYM